MAAALVLATVGLTEVTVRSLGLVDFPVYDVDDQIGYIPKPNQSGRFLNENSWVFNNRSMGTGRPWSPTGGDNILLIGNSVVMGGNPYDQYEKLGPLMQEGLDVDARIWPIAAGGWTNVNETVYIDRNPDVVAATHFFVWEYMQGGLSSATPWRGDYMWPRERPLWAAWYLFRRYVVPRVLPVSADELPPTGEVDPAALTNFAAAIARLSHASGRKTPGLLVLYPTAANLAAAARGGEWLPERAVVQQIATRFNLVVVDVSRDPAWNAGLYRDGVHPTVAGNRVLARIVDTALNRALVEKRAGP